MKFHLIFILFLLSILQNYEAEGMRLGSVVLSSSNHQAITKSTEASNEDKILIAKTDELPSGINRKLMTKVTSSNISKNYKNDENKYDPKPDIKSTSLGGPVGNGDDFLFKLSPENWKIGEEGAEEPCPDNIDRIGVMDYSAPKSKPPSHN